MEDWYANVMNKWNPYNGYKWAWYLPVSRDVGINVKEKMAWVETQDNNGTGVGKRARKLLEPGSPLLIWFDCDLGIVKLLIHCFVWY